MLLTYEPSPVRREKKGEETDRLVDWFASICPRTQCIFCEVQAVAKLAVLGGKLHHEPVLDVEKDVCGREAASAVPATHFWHFRPFTGGSGSTRTCEALALEVCLLKLDL